MLAPREQLFRFLGEGEKERGVALRDDLALGTLGQSFLTEVANRLQHPDAGFVAGELNQTLVRK